MDSVFAKAVLAICIVVGGSSCERVVRWMDGQPPKIQPKPGAVAKKITKPASRKSNTKLIRRERVEFGAIQVVGNPPSGAEDLADVLSWLRTRARVGETRDLSTRTTSYTNRLMGTRVKPIVLLPIAPPTVRKALAGELAEVRYEGGRAAIRVLEQGKERALWFFLRNGRWLWELGGPSRYFRENPGPKHDLNTTLDLTAATAGIHGTGPLVARFRTTAGGVACKLETGVAGRACAHFVALARGLRATLDRSVNPAVWSRVPAFDGTIIKSAADGKALIGGRISANDRDIGFTVADQLDMRLRHDKEGVLGLLNRGPNTGAAGFYITLSPMPELDDRYTVIGRCRQLSGAREIAAKGQATVVSVHIQRGFQ